MLTNLFHGLTVLGHGPALGYLFAGSLIGMIVGVIPGLSGVVVLSIILVFVYHIDLTGTLCLFLGAQCGAFYSASVSAILLNTPAHPEAFPITFDGYPMARRGEPGRALGLSACSTCIGGFIGCGVLLGFLQVIDQLPGLFHPPEYLALVTLAMLLVGTLGTDSVLKAVVAAGAGLMVASIGPSIITGTFRYTFGAVGLYGGISLVALALGSFAVPQMVMVFGTGTAVACQDMTGQEIDSSEEAHLTTGYGKQLIGGVLETFRHWGVLIQSGLVGGLTGIIPGIGGFTGNFLAYGIAKQTSKKRDLYGTGIPDGIIAPEGSSLAKEAGHMIPLLGLGIPGGVSGALFIAALTIKGVRTGYGFTTAFPIVGYEIIWIIAISGVIGTIAGVLIGPQIARVTRVPGPFLVPFIFALTISGPFLADVQFFAVVEVVIFGMIGLGMRRLRYPLGSFILGLVLGPTFETNIYLTRNIYPGFSFILRRPLADVIFAVAIAALVSKAVEIDHNKKRIRTTLSEELAHISDPEERAALIQAQDQRSNPYPLAAPIMTTFFLAVGLYFIFYGVTHYNRTTAIMPVIGAILVAAPALYVLPKDIFRYVRYRRAKALAKMTLASQGEQTREAVPALVGASAHGVASSELLHAEEALLPPPDVLSGPPPPPPPIRERSWEPHGQYRRELVAFLWLYFLLGLSYTFGFIWGIPIFMFSYGMFATGRYLHSWMRRLIFAVLSTAVIWLVVYEMFTLIHLQFSPVVKL